MQSEEGGVLDKLDALLERMDKLLVDGDQQGQGEKARALNSVRRLRNRLSHKKQSDRQRLRISVGDARHKAALQQLTG